MFFYDLNIEKENREYVLKLENISILTAQGKNKIKHKSKKIIEFIKNDLDRCGELKLKKNNSINFNNIFCAYAIFSDQKTLIEGSENMEYQNKLINLYPKYDHLLYRSTNGPPFELDQEVRLRNANNKIIEIIGKNEYEKLTSYAWGEYYGNMTNGEDPGPGKFISDHDFINTKVTKKIFEIFNGLSNEEKGSINALYSMLGNCSILLPFLLISKKITVSEYAQAYIGLNNNFYYVFIDAKNKKEENKRYQELSDRAYSDASLALDYADHTNEANLLTKDESVTHEYKSSLRVNIRTNQIDEKMTYEVLRAIVAFLNTKGGTLVIGVDDDKKIIGIQIDRFKSNDEWLRFLKDKVLKQIGGELLENYIHPEILSKENVGIVKCEKLPVEKTASLNGNIYIRQGPSSKALSPQEAVDWANIRKLKDNRANN